MSATQFKTGSATLTTAVALAQLLERLDHSAVKVDADQYRLVARHLGEALTAVGADAPLQTLLEASPAAAEVYENLNYQHAGLCRSPLDSALAAEVQTREALARAARAAPAPR